MKNLNFKIDSTTFFSINSEEEFANLSPCDEVTVLLYDQKKVFLLSEENIEYAIISFKENLQDCINNNCLLHPSIQRDIGYIWQQYLVQGSEVTERRTYFINYDASLSVKAQNYADSWVGVDYLVFSPPYTEMNCASLWLYNDAQGNIILEVSPTYKWHFIDPEPDDGFIPFSEFMKDYKPILKTIISKDQAQQWLKQTEDFLKIVEKNNPFT